MLEIASPSMLCPKQPYFARGPHTQGRSSRLNSLQPAVERGKPDSPISFCKVTLNNTICRSNGWLRELPNVCRRSEETAAGNVCLRFQMAQKVGLQPGFPSHQTYWYPRYISGLRSSWYLLTSLILSIWMLFQASTCLRGSVYAHAGTAGAKNWGKGFTNEWPARGWKRHMSAWMIALLSCRRKKDATRLIWQEQVGTLTKKYNSDDSRESVRTSKRQASLPFWDLIKPNFFIALLRFGYAEFLKTSMNLVSLSFVFFIDFERLVLSYSNL